MEFREFSEFPDLEEEDFDIKSAFSGSSEENNNPNNYSDDSVLEEDNLDDEWTEAQIEALADNNVLEEDSLDDEWTEALNSPSIDIPEEDSLEEDSLEDVYMAIVNTQTSKEETKLIEDIFSDDNIASTLELYNYDYLALMGSLVSLMDYDEITDALIACNISEEEYSNPTPEIFEKFRNYLINGNVKKN